jgi:hypothetical protein
MGNGYHLALSDRRLVRINLLKRKMDESLSVTLLLRRMTDYSTFANDVNQRSAGSAQLFIERSISFSAFIHVVVQVIIFWTIVGLVALRRQRLEFQVSLEGPSRKHHLTRQSCPYWIASLVDEHASIVVESDQAAIFSLYLLLCSHHHRVPNVSSSHFVGDA